MKATYGEVNGVPTEVFKDPKTDSGTKKSAKGLLRVIKDEDGEYTLEDQITPQQESSDENELVVIFKEGILYNETSLEEIRGRVNNEIKRLVK